MLYQIEIEQPKNPAIFIKEFLSKNPFIKSITPVLNDDNFLSPEDIADIREAKQQIKEGKGTLRPASL
jgi:hypothetical protein